MIEPDLRRDNGDPAAALGPLAPSAQSSIGHVAVRLPAFWPANPAVWFLQAECQFQLAGITTQATKFRHVASILPPEVASDVADVLMAPMGASPYDTLKSALIERTTASERRRYQQLLSAEDLGDRRPSQFLRHMKSLLGDRAPSFDERFLKELFLQRLPPTVQMILASATNLSLAELALHADKIMEVAPSPICTVASQQVTNSYPDPCPCPGPHPLADQCFARSPPANLPVPVQDPAAGLAAMRADIQRLTDTVASLRDYPPAQDVYRPPPYRPRGGARPRSPRPPQGSYHDRRPRRFRSPSPTDRNPSSFCWYHWSYGAHARNCTPPCTWPGNQNGGR